MSKDRIATRLLLIVLLIITSFVGYLHYVEYNVRHKQDACVIEVFEVDDSVVRF